MRCSHCGICCQETSMPLSEKDMRLLEKRGRRREKFVRYDKHGFALLRNRKGYCVFYDVERRRCKAYKTRPLGCRLYPVVCTEDDVAIVDDLCPMGRTVSKAELGKKGEKVGELLRRIELEAAGRATSRGSEIPLTSKRQLILNKPAKII
jgi:Fe-S-cluster containining protein